MKVRARIKPTDATCLLRDRKPSPGVTTPAKRTAAAPTKAVGVDALLDPKNNTRI